MEKKYRPGYKTLLTSLTIAAILSNVSMQEVTAAEESISKEEATEEVAEAAAEEEATEEAAEEEATEEVAEESAAEEEATEESAAEEVAEAAAEEEATEETEEGVTPTPLGEDGQVDSTEEVVVTPDVVQGESQKVEPVEKNVQNVNVTGETETEEVVVSEPVVERHQGADREEVAINVAEKHFSDADKDDNGVILINESNTYKNTEFYKDSLFGIAGGFHLVGLDKVERNVHENGNILANKFINKGDFGTNGVKEISYLKTISGNAPISATPYEDSILVVGKEVKIDEIDNGNAWSIDNIKVDKPNKSNSPNSLWQDTDVEFIDFAEVEKETKEVNKKLAGFKDNATTINNNDENNQEIIIGKSSDFYVYNFKKDDFKTDRPISIKGFNTEKISTLIINIDMKEMDIRDKFFVPKSIASFTDGSSISIGEVNKWSRANVIWNVYDSGESDYMYKGVIENRGAVTGSILAPDAKIILNHNLNGKL
ncbi:collagen-binding domain-containing protein [Aerococcus urinaeequi]|uniref:collagen-binding domain-containing protein n=1 Tax=Aerococcus urinaeequi TaxID=51665 RepID=UPI003D6A5C3B